MLAHKCAAVLILHGTYVTRHLGRLHILVIFQCELAHPSVFYLHGCLAAVHLTDVWVRHFTCGYLMSSCSRSLLRLVSTLLALLVLLLCLCGSLRFLADDVEHTVLEVFLILIQKVLLPVVLRRVRLQVVSTQAMLEQLHAVLVIWLFFEFKVAAIRHELVKLCRLPLAQIFERNLQLLFLDVKVLLVLVLAWKTLPREGAFNKVEQHVANRLEIVTSTLFFAEMSIERSVSGGTRQVLAISEWNMLAVRASIKFGESKVNDVNEVLRLIIAAYQEVIRLDISVKYTFSMHAFYEPYHLNGDHACCTQIKLVFAMLEEALETSTEQVHDHNMELVTTRLLVSSNVIQLRYICCKTKMVN